MSGWLLDTDIVSEARKKRANAGVIAFLSKQPLESLHISIVTLAEIRYGIEEAGDVAFRAELSDWLNHDLRPLFLQRTLPVSEDVMLKWRVLVEKGRRSRQTFPQPDLLIGATALVYGLTVVTRNTKDYRRAGVPVFDPWT